MDTWIVVLLVVVVIAVILVIAITLGRRRTRARAEHPTIGLPDLGALDSTAETDAKTPRARHDDSQADG